MNFKSFDGKIIYVYEWLDVKNPKGIVQVIHGMTEHAKRYEDFANFLNKYGYLVVADDHRGHGKTDPDTLGYCKGDMYFDTLKDEVEITKYYKNKYPNLKYFIFGFSYGSFLTQSYIGKYSDLIDGAIIAGSNKKKDFEIYLGSLVTGFSNLLGMEEKPAKMVEKFSFGSYAKNFSDGEWLSHEEESNKIYHDDPLCGFTCSNRFYYDFFKGLRSLYTNSYKASIRKDLPLLLLAGDNDPVGNMGKGMQKLYNYYRGEAGIKNISLILFPGYRHEFIGIKNGQKERFNEILEFLEKENN